MELFETTNNKTTNRGGRSEINTQQLDISTTTFHRIIIKDLLLPVYKIHLSQKILPVDHKQRREFTTLLIEQLKVNTKIMDEIIFRWMVNGHTYRIWPFEYPRMIVKKKIAAVFGMLW